jgi:hypothetical protein
MANSACKTNFPEALDGALLRYLLQLVFNPYSSCITTFLLVFFFNWNTLFYYPRWFVDESLTASRVVSLLNNETPIGPLDQGSLVLTPLNQGYVPAFPYLLFALPYKLFPQLEPIQRLRITSFVSGMCLVVAVGIIAWRYISPWFAGLAIVLCGFSSTFLYASHLARPDILAAAVGFSALAAYCTKKGWIFLSALLAFLSITLHERAVIFLIVLTILFARDLLMHKVAAKNMRYAVAGCIVGSAAWYTINIAPFSTLEAFFVTLIAVLKVNTPIAINLHDNSLLSTISAAQGTISYLYPAFDWLIFPVILIGLVAVGPLVNSYLKIIIPSCIVVGIFLTHGIHIFKLIMITPAIDLGITVFAAAILAIGKRVALQKVALLTVSLLVYILVMPGVSRVIDEGTDICAVEAKELERRLQDVIHYKARVIGEETYWIYLQDSLYQSWKDISVHSKLTSLPFADLMQTANPEFFLVDFGIRTFLNDNRFIDPFFESLRISDSDLNTFFRHHAVSVLQIPSKCHGNLSLYSLDQSVK